MSITLILGELRYLADVFGPAATVSDGLGGYTEAPVPLDPPQWYCAIEKASVRASEARFSATVTAQATHILNGRYHSGLTRKSTVVWTDYGGITHSGDVLDVVDTGGAGIETQILVSEIVP
jgi:hypothetical protein